jgi:hypothetical protein
MKTVSALMNAPINVLRIAICAVCACVANTAVADRRESSAPESAPTSSVTASASLDFALTLDRFISLSVGSNSVINFDLSPLAAHCFDAAAGSCFGGGTPVLPVGIGTLPVSVRSNAGAVRLIASAASPLSAANGAETIPMSQIKIRSSDPTNFPAPLIVDGGGSPVHINPTAFEGRVTQRSAQWSFSYANTVSPSAGAYHGKILFTATTL